jgi:hypothetical protein
MLRSARYSSGMLLVTIIGMGGLGCAARRAVLYSAPGFSQCGVLEKSTGFLVAQPIEIGTVVEDYVQAFDGDPKTGTSFTEGTLRSYLTGAAGFNSSSGAALRLELPDIEEYVPPDTIRKAFAFSKDEYGLLKLDVNGHSTLQGMLSSAGVRYLVIIGGLSIKRGSQTQAPVMVSTGGTSYLAGGGESRFARMEAQVFVWDVSSDAILWNGFVSGAQKIGWNFTKNTVKGAAQAFVRDLYEAQQ